MNILITSAGRRVSLVRAFQQELKQLLPDAAVFATDAVPHLSAACQIADQAFQAPRVTHPEYGQFLTSLCRQHAISLIIPTIDTELKKLAEMQAELEKIKTHAVVSDAALIGICRDKRLTNQFFNKHGVKTPRQIDRHLPEFPLFIKPYDGSCSQDLYLIKTSEGLTENLVADERLMFMEYLPKEEFQEYTLDLYYDRHSQLQCVVPRLRIEVRSGEVNKAITQKNCLVNYIEQTFATMHGARGCITMQLFLSKDQQQIYGIEINPRFGGGYPLSYQAGANFPKWLIQEYLLGQKISPMKDWQDNLLMLRYDHEVIVHDLQLEF